MGGLVEIKGQLRREITATGGRLARRGGAGHSAEHLRESTPHSASARGMPGDACHQHLPAIVPQTQKTSPLATQTQTHTVSTPVKPQALIKSQRCFSKKRSSPTHRPTV